MNARPNAKHRPLSDRALGLLADIVRLSRAENRAVTASEVIPPDSPARIALYNSLHVLADRWLIVIDGTKIRPRQAGVNMLRARGVKW